MPIKGLSLIDFLSDLYSICIYMLIHFASCCVIFLWHFFVIKMMLNLEEFPRSLLQKPSKRFGCIGQTCGCLIGPTSGERKGKVSISQFFLNILASLWGKNWYLFFGSGRI